LQKSRIDDGYFSLNTQYIPRIKGIAGIIANPAEFVVNEITFVSNERAIMQTRRLIILAAHLYVLLFTKTNFLSIIMIRSINNNPAESRKIKIIPTKNAVIVASPLPNSCENVCESFIAVVMILSASKMLLK